MKTITEIKQHFSDNEIKLCVDIIKGKLEFDFRNEDPDKKPAIRSCTEILPKGSLVVFPSFVGH